MKNVLVVEDEKLMQNIIQEYFMSAGYNVYTADNGLEALEKFNQEMIDLVILDVMMPKLDGFTVCREIRKNSDALIIMVTARETEEDKIQGYNLGVDDYVTKPFSPKVLLAKANNLFMRYDKVKATNEIDEKTLVFEDMVIELDGFSVKIDGRSIPLTKKEFDLLSYLVTNKGKAIERDSILKRVWGEDYFGDGRVLDTNVKTLRKKLGARSEWIRTVVHVGYKFEV